ncbi:MAG: hypothetical protein COU07_02760 [Candidatus Harrisonbacteria bacterium CG10_big_fil_rev_8_21_14_0_10_40_38]|uniref:Glycerol-3-phosphate dehydrogenase n=1 Tax=Candidatus Harrisonbacteria bacterium CG10_big_fil_rev_8_21_14_0_10_40_38 TaxID=1974583 RepID=A0A2H0UU00_9BACT|nr:MAG: hypothetical protein COU07_02760 [Candidatus Harrisonbacteria bacterium CG10_big_fil_rev_8_21_14_0_10_40_38]
MKKVLIIGAGEIGTAISKILESKSDIKIHVWDINPKKCLAEEKLSEIVPIANIIFLCVPTQCLADAIDQIDEYISSTTYLVSLSKGIDPDLMIFSDGIFPKYAPRGVKWGILGGPMLAEELSKKSHTVGVIASHSSVLRKFIIELFYKTHLSIIESDDVKGVAVSGVLKNVYAIGMGIAAGLSYDSNTIASLFSASFVEFEKLVQVFGGKQKTALGPAGLGDLMATGLSKYSSNRSFGFALARDKPFLKETEGGSSLGGLAYMLKKKKIDPPKIFSAINKSVKKGKKVKRIFEPNLFINQSIFIN